MKAGADLGEGGDLGFAFGGVGQQGSEVGGYVGGGEAVLEELGDDAALGDEVDHRDGLVAGGVGHVGELGGVFDELSGEGEGERGDAVDDDEGVADDGGLDGGGAGGYDGGAGVVEGFAGGFGTGDEGEARVRRVSVVSRRCR